MKVENEYLFKQVFSVVVLALLTVTFYMLAVGGLASGIETTIVPLCIGGELLVNLHQRLDQWLDPCG